MYTTIDLFEVHYGQKHEKPSYDYRYAYRNFCFHKYSVPEKFRTPTRASASRPLDSTTHKRRVFGLMAASLK